MTERDSETERRPETIDWQRLADDADSQQEGIFRDYEPIQPEPAWRGLLRKLWAPIAGLGLLVWKAKFLFVAIFKLKLFTTSATMLVSIAAYALWGGVWFGVLLVLLLLVHELGHIAEARRQGIPTSAPMFIPFLGAVIIPKAAFANAWSEAKMALAGPIVGSAGAAVLWGFGEALDEDFLVAMAFIGFLINLFNLLPVVPLDGGRAVAALHPVFWLVGLAGLLALTLLAPNPILILILVVAGFELWSRWRLRHEEESQAYYRILPWQRLVIGAVYIGLAVALGLAASATHIERDL